MEVGCAPARASCLSSAVIAPGCRGGRWRSLALWWRGGRGDGLSVILEERRRALRVGWSARGRTFVQENGSGSVVRAVPAYPSLQAWPIAADAPVHAYGALHPTRPRKRRSNLLTSCGCSCCTQCPAPFTR